MRIGIIGLGHIATNAHIPAIKRIGEAELIAISDINEKRLRLVNKRFGKPLEPFTDYHKMLEKTDIDMIIICLPPQIHGNVVKEALNAKKHVLVEKPLATNLNEAFEIAKLSKKVDRKVCVVQNYRYFPAVLEAKKRVVNGSIGKILCINTSAYIPSPSISRSKTWIYGPWGILDDYGPHPIDMTNWFIANNPSKIYCTSLISGKASSLTDVRIIVEYENEAVSMINLSWLAGATKFELTISGTAGEIILNVNLNQFIEHHGTITPYHQLKDSLNLTKRNLKNIIDGTIFKGSYVYHVQLIRDFIKSILKSTEPPITLTESLRNTIVAEGAKHSLKEGRVIDVNELIERDVTRNWQL